MTFKELHERYPDRSFVWGEERWLKVLLSRDWDWAETVTEAIQAGEYHNKEVIDKGWVLCLPHSCDEWEIGSPKDAEQMIAALQAAISYAREHE